MLYFFVVHPTFVFLILFDFKLLGPWYPYNFCVLCEEILNFLYFNYVIIRTNCLISVGQLN